MRDRESIERSIRAYGNSANLEVETNNSARLQVEILLDIRDLLAYLVQKEEEQEG
jgi:hypothetical protein